MTDNPNLTIWNRFADIDPAFTKNITGKAYKGTSPNPQYVIRCLTELFGPVGKGFGWRVLDERFEPLGTQVIHWCRIEFWWRDSEGKNSFESYGQTKAVYQSRSGEIVDEDAPKKSLTDAITKAASHIGIGASIFLGRWDDSKYFAEVEASYKGSSQKPSDPPTQPLAPPVDPATFRKAADKIIGLAKGAPTLGDLNSLTANSDARIARIREHSEPMALEVEKAISDRLATLTTQKEQAA